MELLIFKLPMISEPFYSFSQSFNKDVEVLFNVRWNKQANSYFMDIQEIYGDPLKADMFVSSIPITEGINLIEQYNLEILAVLAFRVDADGEIAIDRKAELGDTFQVYVLALEDN